jgi:hypothetical protein
MLNNIHLARTLTPYLSLPMQTLLINPLNLIDPNLRRRRLQHIARLQILQLDAPTRRAAVVHARVRARRVAQLGAAADDGAARCAVATEGLRFLRAGAGAGAARGVLAEVAADEVHKLVEDGEFHFELDGVDGAFEGGLDVVYCCRGQYWVWLDGMGLTYSQRIRDLGG